jgi:RNA polymerase sigma-B factor
MTITADSPPETHVVELLDRAATAPPADRERLEEEIARGCLGFARSIARRYQNRGAELDDLAAVAYCALAKAIRQFKPERGNFFAYASVTIHGDIKKYFRDQCWSVRPTRRLQDLQAQIIREQSAEAQDPMSSTELAERLDVDPGDVREAMALSGAFTAASLDHTTPSGRPMHEVMGDEQPELALLEDLMTVGHACRGLSDDDRELLRLRFFDDMTQTEIADVVGVSQMQVSRRLRRALDEIRTRLDLPTAA